MWGRTWIRIYGWVLLGEYRWYDGLGSDNGAFLGGNPLEFLSIAVTTAKFQFVSSFDDYS